MKFKSCLCVLALLCIIPLCASANQRIFISDAAGFLEIPDEFTEIQTDEESTRMFFNPNGESILFSILYYSDLYPASYESVMNAGHPEWANFYENGGELSGRIGRFIEEIENYGSEFDITVTNIGQCAAVRGESQNAIVQFIINRYEVILLCTTFNSQYSATRLNVPYALYPEEQELKPLEE